MNHERYERLKRVFHEAVEAPAGRRADLIREMCSGDAELEAEALLLLGQLDSAGGFLDAPAGVPPPGSGGVIGAPVGDGGTIAVEQPGGLRFASYTVLRTLGRGGMGVVYLAEQDRTNRMVALKVIRAGLATSGALKRFAFEAHVLGRLNHPGIAQVYEAGTADAGQGEQPYFAMELVDGVPIVQHAHERNLPVDQRLALLAQVCDAVEYAHVKGVVHRDLKPANILVDNSGRTKVLDFGVARATTAARDSSVAEMTSLNTQAGDLVGTLPYMSPEQIGGDPDDVDTRSDVYALGVIGYELLAGKPPFAVNQRPPLEAARLIRESEPAPLRSLNSACRGDIETLIRAAMEKDRERRYQSAAALGADIRRFLNNEPIQARPASAWYQAKKFARRHRTGIAIVTLAVAALSAAAVALGYYALREAAALKRESQARALAENRAAIARSSKQFVTDMFGAVSARKMGKDARVAAVLDRAAEELNSGSLSPTVEASARNALGNAYRYLGQQSASEAQHRRALALLEAIQEPEVEDLLDVLQSLGLALFERGAFVEGVEVIERGANLAMRTFGPEHRATLTLMNDRAVGLLNLDRVEDATALLRTAEASCERALGLNDVLSVNVRFNLASAALRARRFEEARALAEEVLRTRRTMTSGEDPSVLSSLNLLSFCHIEEGHPETAESTLRQIADVSAKVYGPSHLETLDAKANLAGVLADLGRAEEAEAIASAVQQEALQHYGPAHPRVIMTAVLRSSIRVERSDRDGAQAILKEVLGALPPREGLGIDSRSMIARVRSNRGALLGDLRRFDEAQSELMLAIDELVHLVGLKHPVTQEAVDDGATLCRQMSKPEREAPWYGLIGE